jgi:hypothetical protein
VKLRLLFFLTAINVQTIIIGQGPAMGPDKRGSTWYQEFQDWTSSAITGQVNTTIYPDLTATGQRFYKVKLIGP